MLVAVLPFFVMGLAAGAFARAAAWVALSAVAAATGVSIWLMLAGTEAGVLAISLYLAFQVGLAAGLACIVAYRSRRRHGAST